MACTLSLSKYGALWSNTADDWDILPLLDMQSALPAQGTLPGFLQHGNIAVNHHLTPQADNDEL